MKYIVIILVLMCSINIVQSQSALQHYERNVEFSNIMLPNHDFKSSEFKIVYPDSIYDTARIIIKKAVFENLKKISVVLQIKDKIYTSIQLGTKSNKRFILLKEMLAKKLTCTVDQLESGTYVNEAINISIKKLGRHKVILLSQKK